MDGKAKWGEGFRVLCVDDDVLNLHLRKQILEGVGCEVTSFSDPAVACSSEVNRFDLVIVDFHMPALNGRELMLNLRQRGACCPTLLLSGGLHELRDETKHLFTACFAKGQDVSLLLREVRQLLEGNSLGARNRWLSSTSGHVRKTVGPEGWTPILAKALDLLVF
jgi:CheY-like chemotaxis protein